MQQTPPDEMMSGVTMTADERRFYRYVAKSNRCWVWTGARTPGKQGQFWVGGKAVYSHVWIWEVTAGRTKPRGWMLSPTCGWSICCNPAHRELRPRGSHLRRPTCTG